MQKRYTCNECDAEFVIKHNNDDTFYEVNFCPFCSREIWEEDENETDDEEGMDF